MKIFEENYKPIEISVKNIEGKEFNLKSLFQTAKETRKVEEIMKDENMFNTDKILSMMTFLFGNNEDFYKQFSLDLLSKVAEFIQEENKKKQDKVTG